MAREQGTGIGDSKTDALVASFPPVPASVRAARRFVLEALAGRPDAESAGLLVSELATNAVQHAHSAFEIRIHLQRAVRIEVYDDAPALPELRQVSSNSPRGRGLQILDAISRRWGIETGARKIVWFELGP